MKLKTLKLINAILDRLLVIMYGISSIANPRPINILPTVLWTICGVLNTLSYIETDKAD